MDCKIIWTDIALEDLREIVAYISSDNPEAGHRVGTDIYETVGLLASFPLIGPPYPRGSNGRIREIVCWSYRIFYRVTSKKKLVEVLTLARSPRNSEYSREVK
jgi:plasmid stabilization system protein ParE